MDPTQLASLALIGLIGGFMAGFLGIGGGVIMVPLLMYGAGIPIKLATGISMAQAFAATVSGLVVHRRNRTLDVRLGIILGVTGMLGALLGSLASTVVSGRALLTVYLLLVVISLLLLLVGPRRERSKRPPVKLWLAAPIGLAVGILAGLLGVGGGFIMIPLMISLLQVPIRVAVGTSLLAILMTTLAGVMGKAATGQFDLDIATYVIIGSVLGAQLGGRANAKVSAPVIRASLALLLTVIMLRTSADLLGS